MKRIFYLFLFFTSSLFGQNVEHDIPFKSGEWLKFRLHYGVLNAGFATLEIENKNDEFVIKGDGWTVGMFKWFFKVKDHYETHIDNSTILPNYFVRDVNEGGYKINRTIDFDRNKLTATIKDKKGDRRADSIYSISKYTGDMISSFYYARQFSADTLKINDLLNFDVFMDYEVFKFSLKFLGREVLDTDFGKIKCLKFVPLVQSGRVFKEDEGVILWVSDDKNKVPIRLKSDLRVGSIFIQSSFYL